MPIKFKAPHFKQGFSAHGRTRTFRKTIYEQTNLMKKPFVNYTSKDTYPYDNLRTIWVSEEPFEAFKMNLPKTQRQHDKGRLTLEHPNWKSQVKAVDMRDYVLVEGVYDKGFYLAIDKKAANRSVNAQKVNQRFIKSISQHDSNYVNVINQILGANSSGQYTDSQTIDRMYLARERYWDRSQEIIDQYNKLKNQRK